MTSAALVWLLAGLLAPEALAAEAEGGHGPQWGYLGIQLLNVAILGFILYRYAGQRVSEALASRSRAVRQQIDDAEEQLRSVESELSGLREQLGRIGYDAARMVREAEEQAEFQRARTLERAEKTAQRIREEARRVADHEVSRARQTLRDDAARLATSLAGEILRDRLTPEDDARLVREFVERIGRSGAGETRS